MNLLAKKDLPVEALVEEMCAALAARSPEAVYAAARSRDIVIGASVDEDLRWAPDNERLGWVSLLDRYESSDALAAGLARRDPFVQAASMALLSRLDIEVARPYALIFAARSRTFPGGSIADCVTSYALRDVLPGAVAALSSVEVRSYWREGLLRFSRESAVPPEIQKQASAEVLALPPQEVLDLWLKGYFRVNAVEVPPEVRRMAPFGGLTEALHADRIEFRDRSDVEDILGSNHEVETVEQKVALFKRVAPTSRTKGDSRLVRWLIERIGPDRANEAVPLLQARYGTLTLAVLEKEETPIKALLEEMLAAIGRWSPGDVYAAAQSKDLWVGTDFNESGRSSKQVPFTERYESPEALAAALARQDPELRGASMALLSRLDMAAATPYAIVLAWHGGEVPWFTDASHAISAAVELLPVAVATLSRSEVRSLWREGLLRHHPKSGVPADIQRQASSEALTFSREEVLQLWLEGYFDSNAVDVPPEIRRQVSLEALLEALRQDRLSFRQSDITDVLGSHPALETVEQRLALLERLAPVARTGGEYRLVHWLMQRFGRDRTEQAVPLLLRLRPKHWKAAEEALLAIGSPPALEPLAAELDIALARQNLLWDAHHVTLGLQLPLQAVYQLDPATATDRFGRFFSEDALATEAGAKLAHDILSIGRGIALAHGGLIYRTAVGNVLSADPRWIEVAARLADHPLLWRIARDVLSQTDEQSRQAALKHARESRALVPPARAPGVIRLEVASRWLDRYLAGEHVQVWAEIHALDADGVGTMLTAKVNPVVRETMKRVRANLEKIVVWLRTKGKLPKRALPASPPGPTAAVTAIERLVKGSIPLSLRCFYEEVGPVDLSCATLWSKDWAGDCSDPLVLLPATKVFSETRYFRTKWNEGLPRDLWRMEPFLYLAPSRDAKHDASQSENEDPVVLYFQSGSVDGMIRRGTSQMYFVDYLRTCCVGGGFEWDKEAMRDDVAPEYRPLSEGLLPL